MYVPFDQMPAHSRLWIFSTLRPFTAQDLDTISATVRAFCDQWDSHGSPLKASFHVDRDRFLLLAVDDSHLGPGGCSIDKSFHMVRSLGERLGISLLERDRIAIERKGSIQMVRAGELKAMIGRGELVPETIMLDMTVRTKGDWIERWRVPAAQSWLNRYWPTEPARS